MPEWIGIALTVVLLLANGFFVAAEFALVKMRPTRLEQLVRQGDARAKLAALIEKGQCPADALVEGLPTDDEARRREILARARI